MDDIKSLSDLPESLPAMNEQMQDWRHAADDYVRDAPEKSVGIALVAGFILSQLPLGLIVVLILRAALFAMKPALVVLGGVKLVEILQERCCK